MLIKFGAMRKHNYTSVEEAKTRFDPSEQSQIWIVVSGNVSRDKNPGSGKYCVESGPESRNYDSGAVDVSFSVWISARERASEDLKGPSTAGSDAVLT